MKIISVRLGDLFQLPQHCGGIEIEAGEGDFSVFEFEDLTEREIDRLAGRRDRSFGADERARLMGSFPGELDGDPIARGDQIRDLDPRIREGGGPHL